MEFVPGSTLHGDRERFVGKLETSLELVEKLAAAAGVLHDAGIIHRDVKPDNVLMRAADSPVLSDLGLCWLTDFSTERLTPEERATGAWGFRAPEHEHERVENVTASADVFSLTKMLWWLIDGGPPFPSAHFEEDRFDLAAKFGDVRMHAVRTLMSKVITADPARRRMRTGGELAAEIRRLRDQLTSPSKGSIATEVARHAARREQSELAMRTLLARDEEIENDFSRLRSEWVAALHAPLAEAASAFAETKHRPLVGPVDQEGDRSSRQPNCIGMAIAQARAYIAFETATNGTTGRRMIRTIEVKVSVRGRDCSDRFAFCGKLRRGLAGGRSFFYREDDKTETPLDPAAFWQEVCLRLVRFGV